MNLHALLEYDKRHFTVEGRRADIEAKIAAGMNPTDAEAEVDRAFKARRDAFASRDQPEF